MTEQMKSSGIDWIGDIPESWSIKRIKYCTDIIMGQSPDSNLIKEDNGIYPFMQGNTYQGDDYKVAKRDWHYRIHALTVNVDEKDVIENAVIDFKHYFTVPITYLITHKNDRILHLDDLFAEQITLKFSTYLARVAIP